MDDEGEAVYASILARMGRPQLQESLPNVVQREWETVERRLRHAAASVAALRQLQAAASYLRPSGDWLIKGMEAQLTSVEELKRRMDLVVNPSEVHRQDTRTKKRTRTGKTDTQEDEKVDMKWTEEDDADKVVAEEDESDVEFIEVVKAGERRTQEDKVEDREVKQVDQLPCGLVKRNHDAMVKVEPVMVGDEQSNLEGQVCVGDVEMAESPIELEVFESSDESAGELEVEQSDSEEVPIELEVFDSESDDDFSPCLEMATKLEKAKADTQFTQFPMAVEQLRSYLVDKKHLAVEELDGYLFVHKHITDDEVDEIGRAIMSITSVGLSLPLRPTIKLALHDLSTIVEQLEFTLGELPAYFQPLTKKLSSYLPTEHTEHIDAENRETGCTK